MTVQTKKKPGPKPKLTPAKTRYALNNPVLIVGVGELERLLSHCIQLTSLPEMSPTQREQVMNRHRLLMREGWDWIKQAKQFYNIKVDSDL